VSRINQVQNMVSSELGSDDELGRADGVHSFDQASKHYPSGLIKSPNNRCHIYLHDQHSSDTMLRRKFRRQKSHQASTSLPLPLFVVLTISSIPTLTVLTL
jgi:hypothetical protein